jgi:hypothetical protein
MSTLKVNTIENLTGNVQLTIQTLNTIQQQSNVSIALAVALGV